MVGFDPFSAFRTGAIDAVFCVVLLILQIPENLELVIVKPVDMLQWDVFVGTASRRHVRRIIHGHVKDPPQAIVTHAVPTSQLRGLWMRYIVRAAG